MMLKFLALQLLWFGSAAFYCSSEQQQLLSKPLSRTLASLALFMGVGLSVLLLAQLYHWLSASFMVIAVLMLCWCLLTLLAGHSAKVSTAMGVGVLLMAILALLGGDVPGGSNVA